MLLLRWVAEDDCRGAAQLTIDKWILWRGRRVEWTQAGDFVMMIVASEAAGRREASGERHRVDGRATIRVLLFGRIDALIGGGRWARIERHVAGGRLRRVRVRERHLAGRAIA